MNNIKIVILAICFLLFAVTTITFYLVSFYPVLTMFFFSCCVICSLILIFNLFSSQIKINAITQQLQNLIFASDVKSTDIREDLHTDTAEPKSVPFPEKQKSIDFENCHTTINRLSENIKNIANLISSGEISMETTIRESEDLTSNMNYITENIKKAFDIADNLSTSARTAFANSEKVQTGIHTVIAALQESMKNAEILHEQSQEIYGIIETLTDISSRINILSINASIVSARAGVHGKPFEVVAKEIRKLSFETDKSLQRISDQITAITGYIENVVKKIKLASGQTDAEKGALFSVAGALQGIMLGVEVFRAVSKNAKEKSIDQNDYLVKLVDYSGKVSQVFDIFQSLDDDIGELKKVLQPFFTDQIGENKHDSVTDTQTIIHKGGL